MAFPASLPTAPAWARASALALGLAGASACATSDAIGPPGEGGGAATGDGGAGSGSGGEAGATATSTSSATTSSTTTVTTGATTAQGSTSSTGAGGEGGGSTSSGGGCGDGAVDGDEACDGADLGGATCATEGFDRGTLACDATCTLDVSGCVDVVGCANGVDDDGDGLVDGADPACTGADDDDELVFSSSCDGFGGAVIDLSTAPGTPIVQTGTTVGAPAALTSTTTASCPSTPGSEAVFRLVVTQTSDLLLSLDHPGTSAGWDPVLYVRAGSCTGAQVGCNDDGTNLKSVLVLSAVAPGTYLVFVDAPAGDAGDFELHVSSL